MKTTSFAAIAVLFLVAASVVACDQTAPTTQGSEPQPEATVAAASVAAGVLAPKRNLTPPPLPFRRIHDDVEARSEIARFNATKGATSKASSPSGQPRELYQACDSGDLNCLPVFPESNAFIAFCRGGPDLYFEACPDPGCIVEDVWSGYGGQLPGTDTGAYIQNANLMNTGFTGVGNILPGGCVLASGTYWYDESFDEEIGLGSTSENFLFPGITLTGTVYAATPTPTLNNWGPASASFNNNGFQQMVSGPNSMMDPSAIFELVFTLVDVAPGDVPFQSLYYEVSYDWDYNTGSSPPW